MEDKFISHGSLEVKTFISVSEENENCALEFNSQKYVYYSTHSL